MLKHFIGSDTLMAVKVTPKQMGGGGLPNPAKRSSEKVRFLTTNYFF